MSGFTFRVNTDIDRAKAKLARLKSSVQTKVIVQALNRTGETVRGRVVKKLSVETGTQQKVIREKVTLSKAGLRKSGMRWYAVVTASRHTVNLIELVRPSQRKINYFNKRIGKGKKSRYRSPGVVAQAWGKRKTFKGTFIGTNRAGELRVYARTGSDRGHLKLISGPALRNEFKRPAMHAFMRSVAAERFPIEFNRLLDYHLRKK